MSEMTTEPSAAAEKALNLNHPIADQSLRGHWGVQYFANVEDALDELNTPPVQSAGEVSATVDKYGRVWMFYNTRPTAPLLPPFKWFFKEFPDWAAAVNHLNLPPAKGDGEVSVNYRDDGTVAAFYIEGPFTRVPRPGVTNMDSGDTG